MKMKNRRYERTKLLQENDYNYHLQDVEEPALFRDMFDYEEIPKIMFNHRTVPMYFPDDIWITDTTFRDGQQSRAPFTVEQIVDLYKIPVSSIPKLFTNSKSLLLARIHVVISGNSNPKS